VPQDRDLRLKPLQVPLMYAFRAAAEARDARRAERVVDERTEARVLTERGSVRRRGANEAELKRNLDIDLSNLVNTVNLGSIVDLAGLDRVRASILNFGVQDITHLTSDAVDRTAIVGYLRDALLAHEPRLIGATLDVTMRDEVDEVNQRIAFEISAEMACRPVDIPLEFVAELDMGSGKVRLSNLAERG
jgi:type VI secretion system protein ImpF